METEVNALPFRVAQLETLAAEHDNIIRELVTQQRVDEEVQEITQSTETRHHVAARRIDIVIAILVAIETVATLLLYFRHG